MREPSPSEPDRPAEDAIRVHLFAGMAAAVGRRELVVPWRDETAAALRGRLAAAHPVAADLLSRSAVSVGDSYLPDAAAVPRGAEVAIIPPVSGG